MSSGPADQDEAAERRARIARTSPDQRLAALRRLQKLAYETGAWQRAIQKKSHEQESQWKSAKQ